MMKNSPSPFQNDAISVAEVGEHIRTTCALPSPVSTVGAEVEWLVIARDDPSARPTVATTEEAIAGLTFPGGSRVTFEPGGQVELSSVPARTPDEVHAALLSDFAVLRAALRSRGLELVASAHDTKRAPRRVSDHPRYMAMERWFAAGGWASAPEMMCNTAAVQVNVGCGPDPSATWRRAHALAPIVAAAFAHSPGAGWASQRLRAWSALDPSRISSALATGDAVADWTAFALAARPLLWSDPHRELQPIQGTYSFEEWINGAPCAPRPPSYEDLALHLSTLFPPVRLKGWLEIRVIDMPPAAWWPVPLAVVSALMGTSAPLAGDAEWLGLADGISWEDAARLGLASPALASAADCAVERAEKILVDQSSQLAELVAAYRERFIAPHLGGRINADPAPARR